MHITDTPLIIDAPETLIADTPLIITVIELDNIFFSIICGVWRTSKNSCLNKARRFMLSS